MEENGNPLKNEQFCVNTLGVHSCRYSSFVVLDDGLFAYSCGVYLKLASLSESKKIKKIKVSNSLVSTVKRIGDFLIVLSYNGQVIIVSWKNFQLVDSFKFEKAEKAISLAATKDLGCIFVGCDVHKGFTEEGALCVFRRPISDETGSYKAHDLFPLREGVFEVVEEENDNFLIVVQRDDLKKSLPEPKDSLYKIQKFKIFDNTNLKLVQETFVSCTGDLLSIKLSEGFICLFFHKRTFFMIDVSSLAVAMEFTLEGAGCLGAFDLVSRTLYSTPESGVCNIIQLEDCTKGVNLGQLYVGGKTKVENSNIRQINYSLNFDPTSKSLFFTNENGLFACSLEGDVVFAYKSIINSCGCGIALNESTNRVAVGDLGSEVTLLSLTEAHLNTADVLHLKAQIFEPIRCLFWDEWLDVIYVGTFGGNIFSCEFIKGNDEQSIKTRLLASTAETVTCLRIYHPEHLDFPLLSAGTTKGAVYLYKISQDSIELRYSFLAHSPQPDNKDSRFGSLNFHSEIWSISSCVSSFHSKSNNFCLTTSSEDQTIKIWQFEGLIGSDSVPRLLNSFQHHDLAVTSVDWKKMAVLQGEVLASCSDDRTINVYDPLDNFKLVKTIKTDELVVGWHTITYLVLEDRGRHLALSTQNGFLVVFNLVTYQPVFCEKIHIGGIEGLCWTKNVLVTCASDLNVNVIKVYNSV